LAQAKKLPSVAGPARFAAAIYRALSLLNTRRPALRTLEQICSTLFVTSLRTEEGQSPRVSVVYTRPSAGAIGSQEGVLPYDPRCFPFACRLPLDARTLSKLAPAADPFASALAVYSAGNDLFIWGLIDQEVHHRRAAVFEPVEVPLARGVLRLTIEGPGVLSAYANFAVLAKLHHDEVVERHHTLQTPHLWLPLWFMHIVPAVERAARRHGCTDEQADSAEFLKPLWHEHAAALARILAQIQRYRHGGALVLLHPKSTLSGFRIKYSLKYDRLRETLAAMVRARLETQVLRTSVQRDREALGSAIRSSTARKWEALNESYDALRLELEGCIRTIASLSLTDGAVVMSADFSVVGFGAEITSKRDPNHLCIVKPGPDSISRVPKAMINHFGTRHRSMLRHCAKRLSGIGFVVSQDGDLRAVMRDGGRVLLFENIVPTSQLQPSDYLAARQHAARKARGSGVGEKPR
jgi:hypothetical protein